MITDGCRHDVFFYDADSAFEHLVAPYLEAGLDEGDAVIAVFVPEKQALLRDALGATAGRVDIGDAHEVYTRPEAVVSRYDAMMRRLLAEGARSIRFMGELPRFETEAQWDAWMLYEGLLNHAFTHFPVRVGCLYDERVCPRPVLTATRRTHPQFHHGGWDDGEWQDSGEFDPTEVVRSLTPEAEPLPGLESLHLDGDARALRRRLAGEMAAAGMPADRIQAMLVAAGEAVSNAQRHGGGLSAVRAGRVDGRFVCEVSDDGPGFDDPLAGHLPPRAGGDRPAGMWVARQVTSRLEFLAAPGGGLTTRLWG
jgi:anti-sigma regulatory factor (Ser/Thr protein kinase)